jgi:phosphatidylserine/phosphatidylglycerophosphate/cardiolipin synthase-like enzyme
MTGPAGDSSLIGCVGNHNREKKSAFPRMHNKFLLFCNVSESTSDLDYRFEVKPDTVWTGSFNLTRNAAMSLENALAITDPTVVQTYFREWEQVLALSEPLDWSSDWCEPQWRVGT